MSPTDHPESPPAGERSPLHNLAGWPSYWARIQPTRPAVEDEERALDWKSFEARIGGLAAWLREQRLAQGDRVAVFLRNRTAALEILFGTARVGGIYLPINL
jgi:acyl-CoA synthetase (AMP-forming)/AMP-acid ligase II